MSDTNTQVLVELGQVKGQLTLLLQMMQNNHDSTNKRIDDMRHAVEGRLEGVEGRVGVLEKNERGTAIRSSASGALAGAIVAAGIAAIKATTGH
jgi:hypothetical protein